MSKFHSNLKTINQILNQKQNFQHQNTLNSEQFLRTQIDSWQKIKKNVNVLNTDSIFQTTTQNNQSQYQLKDLYKQQSWNMNNAISSILKTRKHERFKNYKIDHNLYQDDKYKNKNLFKSSKASSKNISNDLQLSYLQVQKFTEKQKKHDFPVYQILNKKEQQIKVIQEKKNQSKSVKLYNKANSQRDINLSQQKNKHSNSVKLNINNSKYNLKNVQQTLNLKDNQINSLYLIINQLKKQLTNTNKTSKSTIQKHKNQSQTSILNLQKQIKNNNMFIEKQRTLDFKKSSNQYAKYFNEIQSFYKQQIKSLKNQMNTNQKLIIELKRDNQQLKKQIQIISNQNLFTQANSFQSDLKSSEQIQRLLQNNKQLSIFVIKLKKQLKKKKQENKIFYEQNINLKKQIQKFELKEIILEQKISYLSQKISQNQKSFQQNKTQYNYLKQRELQAQNIYFLKIIQKLKRELSEKNEEVNERRNIREIQWKQIQKMQKIFKSVPKQ